jgi:hypothetical protein
MTTPYVGHHRDKYGPKVQATIDPPDTAHPDQQCPLEQRRVHVDGLDPTPPAPPEAMPITLNPSWPSS